MPLARSHLRQNSKALLAARPFQDRKKLDDVWIRLCDAEEVMRRHQSKYRPSHNLTNKKSADLSEVDLNSLAKEVPIDKLIELSPRNCEGWLGGCYYGKCKVCVIEHRRRRPMGAYAGATAAVHKRPEGNFSDFGSGMDLGSKVVQPRVT